MTVSWRNILEFCIELSGQDDCAALRIAFVQRMAEIFQAKAVFLMGLNGTGEAYVSLSSWPKERCPVEIDLTAAERNAHPIMFTLRSREKLIEPIERRGPISALRELLFGEEVGMRLTIAPSYTGASSFPDLLFFVLTGQNKEVEEATQDMAGLFVRYCARVHRMASNYQNAQNVNDMLSLSLRNADQDRKRMKKALPEALSGTLVGRSSSMQKLRADILKLAPTNLSVLVQGETGSGKELAAQELHRLSDRKDGPFVAINMAALPADLVESEFFGHVKGAFTHAESNRVGLFAKANGGVLFLDEIGDMPLALQSKLLRVLQEKKFRPVGSDEEHYSDFRIISATHRNMRQLVEKGLFREDLFYRLSNTRIFVPPLRDRGKDVIELTEHFLQQQSRRQGCAAKHLHSDAETLLLRMKFPGNVRELESLIANAWINSGERSQIRASDFAVPKEPLYESLGDGDCKAGEGLKSKLDRFERQILLETFKAFAGSKTRMAQELCLPRTTLVDKLVKHGLEER